MCRLNRCIQSVGLSRLRACSVEESLITDTRTARAVEIETAPFSHMPTSDERAGFRRVGCMKLFLVRSTGVFGGLFSAGGSLEGEAMNVP